MSASRTVIEAMSRRPYASATLDAAVERQQRRDAGGSPPPAGPAPPETSGMVRAREAHHESFTSRPPPSTVRAEVLQRLGIQLSQDENFGRKLSKDARRALAGVEYLTERERHVLAGIDNTAWAQLAAASDKYKQAAVGPRGVAGIPQTGMSPGEVRGKGNLGDGADGGGGAAGYFGGSLGRLGLGGRGTPDNPTGGRGVDLGGGSDWGSNAPHRGNAMDPRSPTGGSLGGSGGGRGGSPFHDASARSG